MQAFPSAVRRLCFKKMGGKTLHSQARTLALKVLKYFEDEKSNKTYLIPVDKALKRACAATGISKATLLRIKNEAKKTDTQTINPRKKKKQRTNKIELDGFDLCALRNIVDSFYTVRKEIPTLKKILAVAKADINFPGEKTTLRRILVNYLGYKFKKCKNARRVLMQKPDIAAWRARYLRRKKENSELGADKKPAIQSITASDWKKEVNHIERLEKEYWEKDRLGEMHQREFIISFGGEETSSSESESESENEDMMDGIEAISYSDNE
ncbi:hypothetical protein HW555_002084 [Spodoptera exigua]|uniref:Uncharacterized protein n=1 Tax=Spodoptera exigua TaxID=7107 RepID=A0A835GRC4_SPOEX|nr:hypothetical protein HW555_002084 [Spodoptera exigua]